MDIKTRIKSYLNEAELYRRQGLYLESIDLYKKAEKIIRENTRIKNRENLLKGLAAKIKAVRDRHEDIVSKPVKPTVSRENQDLIKRLFSFSENGNRDEGLLTGAIALAKFGQYDRALEEFELLIQSDYIRLSAAKNMLTCFFEVERYGDAVENYEKWTKSDDFNTEQTDRLRAYLQDKIEKKGLDITLPGPEKPRPSHLTLIKSDHPPQPPAESENTGKPDEEEHELSEEEILDISTVGITFDSGPRKGEMVEIDVSYQSGSTVSLFISSKDNELLDVFKEGEKLRNVQYFSPFAMFMGSGIVTTKSQIDSGPKQGNFSVDLKVYGK